MQHSNRPLHFIILAASLAGYLPLAPYLQKIPLLAIPVAMMFSLFAAGKKLSLSEKPSLVVAASCLLYYLPHFNRFNIAEPAANILALFLAIRIAGEQSPRNQMQILAISLFCLAASTLFDLSPRFLFFTVLFLLLVAVALVLLTFQSCHPDLEMDRKLFRPLFSVALLQPLITLPLMLVFFFILPRTQLPIWQGLSKVGSNRPGIAESVQPGDKSSIGSGKEVVFRATMLKQPQQNLYWRVIILNTLSNGIWKREEPPGIERPLVKGGDRLMAAIILEPLKSPFLPILSTPVAISGYRSLQSKDGLFPARGLFTGKRAYEFESRTGDVAVNGTSIDRSFYTRIPADFGPKLKDLGRKIAATGSSDRDKVAALEDLFSTLGLSYAADNLPTGPDAMEKFLFKDKRGHCELFATTFALVLRMAGVPSRLTGGYLGGTYNELGGYYIVTEENAHVWVEAWVAPKGWVVLDPSRYALNFEEPGPSRKSMFQHQLALYVDMANYYWNKAVIAYDLEQQFSAIRKSGHLFKRLEYSRIPVIKVLALTLLTALVVLAILAGVHLFQPKEVRLLKRFRARLKQTYGIVITPATGLNEAIKEIRDPAVNRFVAIYTRAVYHDRKLDPAEIILLRSLLKKIGSATGPADIKP